MRTLAAALAALALSACHHSGLRGAGAGGDQGGLVGEASYYKRSYDGHATANGESFDSRALTAAHRTLPFGARIRVTNLDNGKSVELKVNDRGPYAKDRVLDVSYAAARELDMLQRGHVPVRIEVLSTP